MARIDLQGLKKHFGEHSIIQGVDLRIEDGEFMVFVGPSGCGKSTMLRMIAGLEDSSEGNIVFDGQRVNEIHSAERGAAMVFQSYALYPHMTVAENMGFALRMAGRGKAERDHMVQETAERLQLTSLLDRYPRQLSGGQRQRVAIGRAIVRRPKVFLFDEPLSNLDASLRVQMRIELARLHAELGTTMIYVTHDQTEAMTLGHRIAVFNQGRIEQVGAPMTLYREPANRFVAEFLGSPKINVLPYRYDRQAKRLDFGGFLQLPAESLGGSASILEKGVSLGVRAEAIQLTKDPVGLPGRVAFVENLGDSRLVYLSLERKAEPLVVKQSCEHPPPGLNEVYQFNLSAGAWLAFDAQGTRVRSA